MIYYCGYDQYVNLKYVVSFTINERRGMYHFRFNLVNGVSVESIDMNYDEIIRDKKVIANALLGE
jgi:hypothetical protein